MSAGVLTAANSQFFPTLHAMALSLSEQSIALAVVDHGLTPEQRATLVELGVAIQGGEHQVDHDLQAVERHYRHTPGSAINAWHKPAICQSSPFERTVWIDADAIPLRDTQSLLDAGTFLTRDAYVTQEWAETVYRKTARLFSGQRTMPNFARVCRINNGVFGFARGDQLIDEWVDATRHIMAHPKISRLCVCRDQSSMIAVLASRRTAPTIVDDPQWNYPADGLMHADAHNRLPCPLGGYELLRVARERHPKALVVHWMGPNKPWSEHAN